jgi:hypothetical protein
VTVTVWGIWETDAEFILDDASDEGIFVKELISESVITNVVVKPVKVTVVSGNSMGADGADTLWLVVVTSVGGVGKLVLSTIWAIVLDGVTVWVRVMVRGGAWFCTIVVTSREGSFRVGVGLKTSAKDVVVLSSILVEIESLEPWLVTFQVVRSRIWGLT